MVSPKSKKVYFEYMRVIAIALVIFNHLPGYVLYQSSSGYKQWIYLFITMITRINVPLFFMISGALLLRKNEDFSTVIKKRLPRFLLILLVFEGALFCCYKINACICGNDYEFTLKRFIFGLFSNTLDGTGSYWYLYSYVGIILTLPFMQRIAKGIKKEDFWVLIALHFVFYTVPLLFNILLKMKDAGTFSVTGSFSIPFALGKQFFYPLIGYYLEYYVDVKKLKANNILGMAAVAMIGIIVSSICTIWEGTTTGNYTQNYVQLFDYLTTIVAFIIIKYILVVKAPKLTEGKIGSTVCLIGSLTLGIYLLDPFFKLFFYQKYEVAIEPLLPTLIVSAGWILISMSLGSIATLLLKKIPYFKKLI